MQWSSYCANKSISLNPPPLVEGKR